MVANLVEVKCHVFFRLGLLFSPLLCYKYGTNNNTLSITYPVFHYILISLVPITCYKRCIVTFRRPLTNVSMMF